MQNAWMDLHIANNVVSYHGPSGHHTCSQGFFHNTEWLISFLLQLIVCLRKEALGMRLSGYASLLSFQTQQEQTVFMLCQLKQ